MKNLHLFLISCFTSFLCEAQITTPVIKANFGVEADLRTNYYNNANQPGNDDWYSNGLPGSGNFVIDTTGAAALVAGYAIPANRTKSFSRLMRVSPYTTVNNRIWLDAIFHRDFHGNDSTVYAAGSNKNGMSPASWSAPPAQNIPDKNDILDAFLHIRRAGPNLTDSLWMFGAISIENTTGNRYFDFELFQTDIRFDRSTLTFSGYGAQAGHTAWQFDANGNILRAGDIIFTAEYSSSALTMLQARVWINRADLLITPAAFDWGGAFDGASTSSTYGYASIVPKTTGAFYSGLQSGNGVWAGAFSLVRQDNSLTTTYIARQFMEFSVNMSKLGLDPGAYGINPCGSPFRRVLIKTRASTSFTAELKDFIAPFSLFNYPPVRANALFTYFCGFMQPTTITVANYNPELEYNWTTTNGTIQGSTTGPSIIATSPGTYYVAQQFDNLCPIHSMDSITIRFDSICTILTSTQLRLSGAMRNNVAQLEWVNANNESAASYELQFGTDNVTFTALTDFEATAHYGSHSYLYAYNVGDNNTPITYRIKMTDRNGREYYSNTILLRQKQLQKLPVIFPNPVKGNAWVSLFAAESGSAQFTITDNSGRQITTFTAQVTKGENLISLKGTAQLSAGVYLVTVQSKEQKSVLKIIKE